MRGQLRGIVSAAALVGIVVGLALAVSWHVFVPAHLDTSQLAASGDGSSVAFVGYEIEFFEPAPAWLPTVVVLPVLAAAVFACLGLLGERAVRDRRVRHAAVIVVGGALGVLLGVCAAVWARTSPPTYIGLTDVKPFRIALANEAYVWILLPTIGGVIAGIASVVATAIYWRWVSPAGSTES